MLRGSTVGGTLASQRMHHHSQDMENSDGQSVLEEDLHVREIKFGTFEADKKFAILKSELNLVLALFFLGFLNSFFHKAHQEFFVLRNICRVNRSFCIRAATHGSGQTSSDLA